MSDFDAVLERLLADPSFAASLAADPAATLAGYRLGADEVELLSAQISTDAGAQSGVEARTSRASMFGLLVPLAGAIGIGGAVSGSGQSGFGPADHSGFGPAEDAGPAQNAGPADQSGFGPADADAGTLGGLIDGDVADAIGERITGGDQTAPESSAMPPMPAAPTAPPPEGYHTRVDVDGDGDWDKHWYVRRDDGGVDIMADMNGDGRADFVGHDFDRDGLVDAADYDKNRDGVFETHMFDDDGDGWLDRKIISPGP